MRAEPSSARHRVQRLLDHGHNDDPAAFSESAPAPFGRTPPAGWLWQGQAHPATRFGLRDARAYTQLADPESLTILHQPKAEALRLDAGSDTFDQQQISYIRHSVDLTMKGGTTSGVVYPLAVCEVARRFRLRNVGGASAGAIAAACAAAAEVGRAGLMAPTTRGDLGPLPAEQPPPPSGRARAGFVGLADLAAWYTQSDAEPGAVDEFRIGQLFQPTPISRPVFRMIIAVMRGRFAQVPLLLTAALGSGARFVTAVAMLGAPVAAMDRSALAADAAADWLGGYLVAAGWLLAMSLTIISLVVLGVLAAQRLKRQPSLPSELAEPVRTPGSARHGSMLPPLAALGLGIAVAAVLAGIADQWSAVSPSRMILVWIVLVQVVLGIQIGAVLKIVLTARRHRFGLLSGADPVDQSVRGQWRWDRIWDRVAGAPERTVSTNLMDWMHAMLSDLAGLSDPSTEPAVLRFGHLWFGAGYAPGAIPRQRLLEAAADAGHRLVNLELMTSELVHGTSKRFPLPVDDVVDGDTPRLLIRRSDLGGDLGPVLPGPVIDAICSGEPVLVRDVTSGETITDLVPLPMPWDLPVLFAVRLSMALPGLFQAVRIYRPETPQPIRDDFGVRLATANGEPSYPPDDGSLWVQEMWMSDGGITSNFPIHFFDNPLPLWPTLGINLGRHPRGAAHQDVWLPDDGESGSSVPTMLGNSMLGFVSSVFNTAMSWRDTAQTFMPAFRGRVAWVRQRPDEGGSNLFMDAETISALAVRGAMAGARLSRRYADEGHWRRHQWLRMRVALGNLSALDCQATTALGDPIYSEISTEGPGRIEAIRSSMVGSADPVPADGKQPGRESLAWFEPRPGFWTAAAPLLAALRESPGADPSSELNDEVPLPAPSLRQVPPV